MRIIDADELEKTMYATADLYCAESIHVDVIADIIGNAPTVDAVPVVHGRWIETKHGFCCNQCHTRRPLDWDGQMWLSSFCPNCGARMDGKDGEQHD